MTYQEACDTDPLVHAWTQAGLPLKEIIGAMAERHKTMMDRMMKLDAVAPRRVTLPDGRVMVWHCPDHLIPEKLIN